MLGKNLVLKLAQNGSRSMRFQYSLIVKYFINRLSSEFDFWHADRHIQCLLTDFLKKFLFGQIVHRDNSVSDVRIF